MDRGPGPGREEHRLAALPPAGRRALAARRQAPGDDAPIRLAIDRSFVIKGRGTVVTGTLRGGRLAQGAQLRLVPGDREVRAREVQVHGGRVDSIEEGGRVALNLAAIDAAINELLAPAVGPLLDALEAYHALAGKREKWAGTT